MHPDKNISKGFAFVEFATKNQCHNAINKLNGTTFKGRTIILDFSLAKNVYLEEKLNNENTVKIPG
jgi:RNA recognition motif-containing protein